MQSTLENIVIVGGGTAGWLTAGILAASFKHNNQTKLPTITLVESPNIPIAGVGEGTWPSMRRTLKHLGIRESDFITQCDATFKHGAKFSGWVTGSPEDSYYHPLVLPYRYDTENLATHFVNSAPEQDFASLLCAQGAICDLNLSPKNMSHKDYQGHLNYAYHLDATKFSQFLQHHCTKELGVQHIVANVQQVESASDGDIAALLIQDGNRISGDLFIDCSGFKGLLINEHFNVPYRSCKDILFSDRAAAIHLPYPQNDTIAPYTISTATDSGWIWDIGLPSRRGTGHVYSSEFMTDDEAINVLSNYANQSISADDVRIFKIEPGHRERFWHKNCVAIGLSAGFLEPLEASSLVLVEMSAHFIAEQFPKHKNIVPIVANRFNKTFTYRWSQIIDFLKLHYVLSERTSPFWQRHRDKSTWTDSLKEQLELWKYNVPWHGDFDHAREVFPSASYQYVLYGMRPRYTQPSANQPHGAQEQIKRAEANVKQQISQFSQQLYDQRTLLHHLVNAH